MELPKFVKAKCSIDPYPIQGVNDAMGSVIDDNLHVCGGMDPDKNSLSTCYSLTDGKWEERPNLTMPRQNAGSSIWRGNWLLTGGYYNNHGRRDTSEEFLKGTWTPSMKLSREREGHCQITDGSNLLIAGEILALS